MRIHAACWRQRRKPERLGWEAAELRQRNRIFGCAEHSRKRDLVVDGTRLNSRSDALSSSLMTANVATDRSFRHGFPVVAYSRRKSAFSNYQTRRVAAIADNVSMVRDASS